MHSPRLAASTLALILLFCASCNSSGAEASYCAEIETAARVIPNGGTVAEYNTQLALVLDASPADHADTWQLMLTLSREPFTYENFNPALDSIDEISAEIRADCGAVYERVIVDNSGRLSEWTD